MPVVLVQNSDAQNIVPLESPQLGGSVPFADTHLCRQSTLIGRFSMKFVRFYN